MSTTATEKLTGHAYDGIEEFDNPTPGWWHAIFIGTVFFSFFYFVFWEFSSAAWTAEDSWKAAQVAEFRRVFGAVGNLQGDENTVRRMMGDPQMLAIANGIFVSNCAACHARDGGGINGVNLTDDSYKNVRSLPDIFSVITRGAANGAMPAWEQRLSQNERVILAAYVATLRGTRPASPRAAEGDAIPPFPAPIAPAPTPQPAQPK